MNVLLGYVEQIARAKTITGWAVCVAPLLRGLSFVYGLGLTLNNFFYQSGLRPVFRAPYPVVSIGNIAVGGTGKTPFVILVQQILEKNGFNPMVLIRGYMPSQENASDEAVMLAELLGPVVFSGADRCKSFRLASRSASFNAVILDDGFQHRRFARDLDIVLIDANDAFGNGALLPRGILREPVASLHRAQVVVFTHADRVSENAITVLKGKILRINPGAVIVTAAHRPCGLTDVFTGEKFPMTLASGRAAAFCAIGSPQSFHRTLKDLGMEVVVFRSFPDHYLFREEDVMNFADACRLKNIDKVFLTHKDAVKMHCFRSLFQGLRLIIVDIKVKILYGENELISSLVRLRRP